MFSCDTCCSTLAEAAVPNCSGSQPTLSLFCFQVLMIVTSYFQLKCFPTQADLRNSLPAFPLSFFKCQLDNHKSSFTSFFFYPHHRDCASVSPIVFREVLYLLRWSLQRLLINCVILGDLGSGIWTMESTLAVLQWQRENVWLKTGGILKKETVIYVSAFLGQSWWYSWANTMLAAPEWAILIPSLLHSQMPTPSGNTEFWHHAWKNVRLHSNWSFQGGVLACFFPLTNPSVLWTQPYTQRPKLKSSLVAQFVYEQLSIFTSLNTLRFCIPPIRFLLCWGLLKWVPCLIM